MAWRLSGDKPLLEPMMAMFYDVKRCHLATIKFTQWPTGNDNNANNNEWYTTHGLQYDIVVAGVLESCHNDTTLFNISSRRDVSAAIEHC